MAGFSHASSTFRPGRAHRVIDGRRRVVPLCRLDHLPEGSPPSLREQVRLANVHRWRHYIPRVAVFIVWVAVLDRWVFRNHSDQARLFMASVWLLIMALITLVEDAMLARGRGVEAIQSLHGARLCPSCCYELGSVSPAEDGCTVCPECGAAWRLGASPAATARTYQGDAGEQRA